MAKHGQLKSGSGAHRKRALRALKFVEIGNRELPNDCRIAICNMSRILGAANRSVVHAESMDIATGSDAGTVLRRAEHAKYRAEVKLDNIVRICLRRGKPYRSD